MPHDAIDYQGGCVDPPYATIGVYRHSRAIGSTPKPAAACYEVQIATLDSPIDPVTSEQKAIAEPSSQPRRRPALPVPSD
jgi:hypothetical protein